MSNWLTGLQLAARSLANRRATALLTALSIAVSVALLVGVNRVRSEARASFTQTISGAELIVGARSGPINLLLYSVFRIGNATNNVAYTSYQRVIARPEVAWAIPISLGDSHRGYRVMGTDDSYLAHYRYGNDQPLALAAGEPFKLVTDAILGFDVAQTLGYQVGDPIVVSHGIGATSFTDHDNWPFQVSGILKRTGTPVDRTVHISLPGIEAIHSESDPPEGGSIAISEAAAYGLETENITAFILGLNSRLELFGFQRLVNQFPDEPLLAIIPGVTLQELWGLVGNAELALLVVSAFVVLAGLIGLMTTLLTAMAERRREMAVLRSVGAGPGLIAALMIFEAGLIALVAAVTGVLGVHLGMLGARDVVLNMTGINLSAGGPGTFDLAVIGVVTGAAMLIAAIPAWRGYRHTLADGLTIRL
ncbi:MAG: ABC transporter permease [Pseudomonadota bacterium]